MRICRQEAKRLIELLPRLLDTGEKICLAKVRRRPVHWQLASQAKEESVRRGVPARKFQIEEARRARRERKLRQKLERRKNLKPWPLPDTNLT
jgi:hypothetical protein